MAGRPKVLVLDNLDSFTFNLVLALRTLRCRVQVLRPAGRGAAALRRLRPSHLVVSPGPGRPEQATESLTALRAFAGRIPVLGVCLGHQALATAFGARVGRSLDPAHGKASAIRHTGLGVFRGLPDPFDAGRYHSLTVDAGSLTRDLAITAWTGAGEIMGLRHASGAEGVQFHPESILTPCGPRLLANFLSARR